MFEHFGIKDIFSGLWKFKYFILAATVCLGVMGGMLFTPSTHDGHEEYYYSQTWYFKHLDPHSDKENKAGVNYAKTYNGLLESDVCKEFVKSEMLKTFSEEEVLQILGQNDSANGLTWSILTESVNHLVVDGEDAVSLAMKTSNEKFGKTLMDAYDSFAEKVEDEMKSEDNQLEISNLGLVKEVYQVAPSEFKKSEAVLLGSMTGFVLSCIVVFFVCLWVPTINRKSDFDEYGIFVLGKIEEV